MQFAAAGHLDLAAVALRRISPAAKNANAQLSPEAFDTFTDLVGMIGRLAGGSAA